MSGDWFLAGEKRKIQPGNLCCQEKFYLSFSRLGKNKIIPGNLVMREVLLEDENSSFFHSKLRVTVPFVTAHLDIFHCMHHPVIPKSDLYFTFCSTLIRT